MEFFNMYIREDILIAPKADVPLDWTDLAGLSTKAQVTVKNSYFDKIISKSISFSVKFDPSDSEFNLPTIRRSFKFTNINAYDSALADFNRYLKETMGLDSGVVYEQCGFTFHILHEDIVSDKA